MKKPILHNTFYQGDQHIINYRQKVLQLCCFTNLWGDNFEVESHDLKHGKDIFDLPQDYGKNFDIVCAAPPCDQFTIANNQNWALYPSEYIAIAEKCFQICQSGQKWFLENPPGRIEKFIPALKQFRIATWTGYVTNKQYVIYGNFLFLYCAPRYGKKNIVRDKVKREAWQPDLIETIKAVL